MKKMIWLVLVLSALGLCLVACGNPQAGNDVSDQDDTAVEGMVIVQNGATEFCVIRGDSADQYEVDAAVTLRKAINAAGSLEMTITTDWVKRGEPIPEGTKELLVGKTNRPETEDALSRIGEDQFIIKAYADRVVILGGTKAGTVDAVNTFVASFVTGAAISLPENYEYIGTTTYVIKEPVTVPNASEMKLTDVNGPITDAELTAFMGYVQSKLAMPVNNIGNPLVYGRQGLGVEAMGLVYEATGDAYLLNLMIKYCDAMLYCRNDMPGGDKRLIWTGKVEPAWPNKEATRVDSGYAASEQGDIIGHILYCAYLILQDESLYAYKAPENKALDCGVTYYDRAMYYVSKCEESLKFLTDHYIDSSLKQRFPTDARWKAMDDKKGNNSDNSYTKNAGYGFPVNQQMMFNNGFQRAEQCYRILGQNDKADYYHSLVETSVKWIATKWTLKKASTGEEYYVWWYHAPDCNRQSYEDYGHAAFDVQGFYRVYTSGIYSCISQTDMKRIANTARFGYYDKKTNTIFYRIDGVTPSGKDPYKSAKAGWILMGALDEQLYSLNAGMNYASAIRGDAGIFGHAMYAKYLKYGSAVTGAITIDRVSDKVQ